MRAVEWRLRLLCAPARPARAAPGWSVATASAAAPGGRAGT